jgi:hypothetical protein
LLVNPKADIIRWTSPQAQLGQLMRLAASAEEQSSSN